jgi:hypothetical protein
VIYYFMSQGWQSNPATFIRDGKNGIESMCTGRRKKNMLLILNLLSPDLEI